MSLLSQEQVEKDVFKLLCRLKHYTLQPHFTDHCADIQAVIDVIDCWRALLRQREEEVEWLKERIRRLEFNAEVSASVWGNVIEICNILHVPANLSKDKQDTRPDFNAVEMARSVSRQLAARRA